MSTQGDNSDDLKRDFEAKVVNLEREIAKHKEQYRVTFDQLAEKEKELRDREDDMETIRVQGSEREAAMQKILEKQR